jgi:hypothetical protein
MVTSKAENEVMKASSMRIKKAVAEAALPVHPDHPAPAVAADLQVLTILL